MPSSPSLADAALYGVTGQVVRSLAPHTEAHPAALLLQILVAFGNLVGRGPYCEVESTRHSFNLFLVLVGESGKARKGTSWNHIARLFAGVDPLWLQTRVQPTRLSASNIVKTLREQTAPADQRLLIVSEEFAAVLSSLKRGNNQLSPLLRCAWDDGILPALGPQPSQRASGTHLSLIAHITQHELSQSLLPQEASNGFANRCLWVWVERSNCLPDGRGPDAEVLKAAGSTIRKAVAWASATPEILFLRDQEATDYWAYCYPDLSYHKPGLRGAATSRGEAQVLRLSAIYAALDESALVCLPHLQAALAVWDYCCQSATRLFGTSTGNPVADRIREAVQQSTNGLTRTQIRRLFSGHIGSDRIDAALEQLVCFGALENEVERTGGRPSTRWASADNE